MSIILGILIISYLKNNEFTKTSTWNSLCDSQIWAIYQTAV